MASDLEQPGGKRATLQPLRLRPAQVHAIGGDRLSARDARPQAVVVAGMHRSGTSALTRTLSLCGLGLPRTLMTGNAFNQNGYWESDLIKLCNDSLLHDLDSAWDDPATSRANREIRYSRAAIESIKAVVRDQFASDQDIVIKDPRISILFGAWREALDELGYEPLLLIPIRHPLEVAASLNRRDGFPTIKSLLIWLNHLLTLELESRGVARAFLFYDDLLLDWRSCMRRVERALGLRLSRWTDAAELQIDSFLSLSHRHHSYPVDLLETRKDIPAWIAAAYRWTLQAAREDVEPPQSNLGEIASQFHAAADIYGPLLSFERNKIPQSLTATASTRTQQFVVRLYFAGMDEAFCQANSVHTEVELIEAPRFAQISIPPLSRPIAGLRLDPSDEMGQFRLHELRLSDSQGSTLWQWNGNPATLSGSDLVVHATPGRPGVLLEFTTNDPQITLPAGALAGNDSILVGFTASLADTDDLAYLRESDRARQIDQIAQKLDTLTHRIVASEHETARARTETQAVLQDLATELTSQAKRAREEVTDMVRIEIKPHLARAVELARQANLLASNTDAAAEARATDLTDNVAGKLRTLQDQIQASTTQTMRALGETNRALGALDTAQRTRDTAVQTADHWRATAEALQTSTSWRITAPLRMLGRITPQALFASAKNTARAVRDSIRRAMPLRRSYAPVAPPAGSDAALLAKSPLFDPEWYLAEYPDVAHAGVDPIDHFLHYGAFEGRNPGPCFDCRWYFAQNPDVQAAAANPLVHYLRAGRREGRTARPPTKRAPWQASDFGDLNQWAYLGCNVALAFERGMPISFSRTLRRMREKRAPSSNIAKSMNGAALFNQLFSTAVAHNEEYVPLNLTSAPIQSRVQAIAFYLPQFHPIPENDAWWGKGFTEWTNVSKAVPQFLGHYQPRLPDELGFYDLRLIDVQRRQVELAKQYGIGGFCFHYYWFSGRKRLLERPLDQFIAARDIDFPFCVCWANENWTRRWDGLDQEILMEQRHEPIDDLEFIEDLAPILRDPRYIKVNGRPLVIVYRAGILPNPKRTTQVWRDYCRDNGLEDPYLVAAQTFGLGDPRPLGFDAAIEFPPHKLVTSEIQDQLELINPIFDGKVFSYKSVAEEESVFEWPEYPLFKTVMPSWDNEARKPGRGHIFADASPKAYKSWFDAVCAATNERHMEGQKFVFINAWNEWAEGAYLEPDRRFGYAYLQATREVLAQFPRQDIKESPRFNWPPFYVFLHAFYPEVLPELLDHIRQSPAPVTLIVTCPPEKSEAVRSILSQSGLECPYQVVEVENKGRDVLAFLEGLRRTHVPPEAIVLKVHTKVTSHRLDGSDWRRAMISCLMQPSAIARALDAFTHQERLSFIAPSGYIVPLVTFIGENQPHIDALLRRGGWAPISPETDVFAAGTMFFIRRRNLDTILALNLTSDVFEEETGQKDGTVAHALERLFTLIVLREGGEITDSKTLIEGGSWTANAEFDFAVKTPYLFQPS